MLDIGFGEFVLLGVLGLIVVGPERLPQYAAQAARFLRQLRAQVSDARSTLISAAAVDPETLRDLRDLDPRKVLSGVDDSVRDIKRSIKEAPLDPDTT